MTTTPLPMPIRILVKGASTVSWTSFMGGPRTDFTFPRAAEVELLAGGYPVQMQVNSVPAELTRNTLKTWQQEAGGWSPDVIVLSYGHAECVHLLLPLWLQRHSHGMTSRPGPVRDRYRKHLLAPTWRLLARVQQKIDRALPTSVARRRVRRVAADYERLLKRLQMLASPLILVLDIPGPNATWQQWFPGMAPRIGLVNEQLEQLVERIDKPNVRLFRLTDVTAEFEARGEEVCSDGAHFTPAVHAAIGEKLGQEILGWARTQTHLGPAQV
ncbi:hypothetical protein [Aeromicrobium stalagmiti]|uniref:hypothetical protein n=1 Tax=Aeromicrobium stalagmiti TaxID=2738988 RepID=UPI0015691578|nr:hypothetical protein [Aeromicrobium stalagmiti]NRQ49340.1 hypothetical protein [Aeromicrobium stalagmiti]